MSKSIGGVRLRCKRMIYLVELDLSKVENDAAQVRSRNDLNALNLHHQSFSFPTTSSFPSTTSSSSSSSLAQFLFPISSCFGE